MKPQEKKLNSAEEVTAESLSRLAARHVNELTSSADQNLMDLGLNLVRASGNYVQMSERRGLRLRNLRWASFSTLFMASLFPGIEARSIAKLTGVTRQATSQVIISLEQAKRISRRNTDPTDKRLIEIQLTPEGRADLQEAMRQHMSVSAEWFSRLSPEEQHELNRLLKKLLAG